MKKQNNRDSSVEPDFTSFVNNPSGCARQKAILFERLIEIGHQTDLVRCWGSDQYRKVHTNITNRLNGLLPNKCDPEKFAENFLKMAADLCSATGAAVKMLKEKPCEQNIALTVKSANNVEDTRKNLHAIASKASFNYGISTQSNKKNDSFFSPRKLCIKMGFGLGMLGITVGIVLVAVGTLSALNTVIGIGVLATVLTVFVVAKCMQRYKHFQNHESGILSPRAC